MKALRFLSQASFAVIATYGSSPSAAQSSPPTVPQAIQPQATEPQAGLQDIVVTARKRAENLQNVPVAVTVLSAADIESQSIKTVYDVQNQTPNLRIRTGGSNASALVYGIRGQVNPEIIATQDASVGVYVDGLIWARAIGANTSLLDVSSVQVLKGPQGTLFGRNTTGGALLLTTNDPVLDETSGQIGAGYGTYNRWEASGILNLPIGDKVALRIAGKHVQSDGMFHNDFRNVDEGTENTENLRVKVLLQPTDRFRIVVSGEYFDMNQVGIPWQNLGFVPPAGFDATNFEIGVENAAGNNYGPLSNFTRPNAGRNATYGNTPDFTKARTHTAFATATWEIGAATIKAIGGYRDARSLTQQDLDGTPYSLFSTLGDQKLHQWSGELQVAGKAVDNRLDYVVGIYAFREKGYDISASQALSYINPTVNNGGGDVRNTSKAAYVQGTYRITDHLSATGGLRYSKDGKFLDAHPTSGVGGVATCLVPVELQSPTGTCGTNLNRSDGGWSYTASLDYKFDDGPLVYAKISHSFRAGGQNLRGVNVTSFASFAPEKVTEYEAGLKSEFLDNRVRLNIAAYLSKNHDLQRVTNSVYTLPDGSLASASFTSNAASATIYGFEGELEALITKELRLTANVGYTHPKYDKFPDVSPVTGAPIDRSDEPFDFISKLTAGAALEYTRDLGFGDVTVRGDWSYTGSQYYSELTATEFSKQSAYSLFNARLSWKASEAINISVFGRNLANKVYYQNVLGAFTPSLGIAPGFRGPRRTLGVEAAFRF